MMKWWVVCTIALNVVASAALGQAVATSIPLAPPAAGPVVTPPLASIPEAPPASAPVITSPLTSVPITPAVPPPATPTYDHSYWTKPIWPAESRERGSEALPFDRGVNSAAAAAAPLQNDDGTHGQSLGAIAREQRRHKLVTNREFTNDDLEEMSRRRTKAQGGQ